MLWLTTDGTHWRDVTPPGTAHVTFNAYPTFEAASFLNPTTGWITTWNDSSARVTVYRTDDGGARWSAFSGGGHVEAAGSIVLIQLVSASVAFSESLEPTGPGMGLAMSSDGGRSWREIYNGPPPLVDGGPLRAPPLMPMVFVSAKRGFADVGIPPLEPVGGVYETYFFRTTNGGKRWICESPPWRGSQAACPRSLGSQSLPARSWTFGLPVFSNPLRGVLPSEMIVGDKATIGFATTSDGGASWKLGAILHITLPTPPQPCCMVSAPGNAYVAVASAHDWWVTTAATHGVTSWRTTDSGRTWTKTTDDTLPGGLQGLQALNATHAMVEIAVNRPAGNGSALYVTADGGRRWQRRL